MFIYAQNGIKVGYPTYPALAQKTQKYRGCSIVVHFSTVRGDPARRPGRSVHSCHNLTKQRAKVADMAFARLGGCWVLSKTTHTHAHTRTASYERQGVSKSPTGRAPSLLHSISTDTPRTFQWQSKVTDCCKKLAGKESEVWCKD